MSSIKPDWETCGCTKAGVKLRSDSLLFTVMALNHASSITVSPTHQPLCFFIIGPAS